MSGTTKNEVVLKLDAALRKMIIKHHAKSKLEHDAGVYHYFRVARDTLDKEIGLSRGSHKWSTELLHDKYNSTEITDLDDKEIYVHLVSDINKIITANTEFCQNYNNIRHMMILNYKSFNTQLFTELRNEILRVENMFALYVTHKIYYVNLLMSKTETQVRPHLPRSSLMSDDMNRLVSSLFDSINTIGTLE